MKKIILTCICAGILINCNSEDNTKSAPPGSIAWVEAKMNRFYLNDNYDSSIKYLNVLIAADSLNGEYFYKRGYSFGQIDMREEAIADFKKAIKLNHRVSEAHLAIGNRYIYRNDSLALYHYKKSLEADPSNEKAAIQMHFCEKVLRDRKRKQ